MEKRDMDAIESSTKYNAVAKLRAKSDKKIMVVGDHISLGNSISTELYEEDIVIVEDFEMGLRIEYNLFDYIDKTLLFIAPLMSYDAEQILNDSQIKYWKSTSKLPKLQPYQIEVLKQESAFLNRFEVFEQVNEYEYRKIRFERILELLKTHTNVSPETKYIYDL